MLPERPRWSGSCYAEGFHAPKRSMSSSSHRVQHSNAHEGLRSVYYICVRSGQTRTLPRQEGWRNHLSAVMAILTAISMQRTYAQKACARLAMARGNQPPATVTENWPVSVSLKHLFLS